MIITKDFNFGNKKEFIMPEDLGKRVAYGLLDEIFCGGCIDSTNQSFALMLLALTKGDNISQIKLGRVT
jgi:RNA 3'-terminal phosphate cyclase-like protein